MWLLKTWNKGGGRGQHNCIVPIDSYGHALELITHYPEPALETAAPHDSLCCVTSTCELNSSLLILGEQTAKHDWADQWMYVSVCLSVIYVCMYLSIHLSIYLCIYVSMHICMYVSMYVSTSHLCVHYLSIHSPTYPCTCMCLCIHLSLVYVCIYYLSTYVSMYLSMRTCMCVSVCMYLYLIYVSIVCLSSHPPIYVYACIHPSIYLLLVYLADESWGIQWISSQKSSQSLH
jgi:hypothetical protein